MSQRVADHREDGSLEGKAGLVLGRKEVQRLWETQPCSSQYTKFPVLSALCDLV